MMDDLVKWLREEASFAYHRAEKDMLTEAADRIEALEAKVDRLREALEHITDIEPDTDNMDRFHDIARAALGEKNADPQV